MGTSDGRTHMAQLLLSARNTGPRGGQYQIMAHLIRRAHSPGSFLNAVPSPADRPSGGLLQNSLVAVQETSQKFLQNPSLRQSYLA